MAGKSAKSVKKEKKSFETAMTELEDAVRQLESGNLTLDEAMEVYAQAVRLIRTCHGALETAAQRVRLLTEQMDGSVQDVPFAPEEN